MSRVFVINAYGNPIESAARFGKIVELTEGTINPFAVDRLAWTLAPGLADFDNEEDYLMLTGPGSGYMVVASMLFSRFNRIKCLRYESSIRDYLNVEVTKPVFDVPNISSQSPPGRIFVLNYSGHSIMSAFEFSPLPAEDKAVFLTRGNIDQFKPEELAQQIALGSYNQSGLLEYQRGDMLLISGPGLLHIICASVFVAMGKDMSLLLFNPKQRNYIPRDIVLSNIIRTEKLAVESAA